MLKLPELTAATISGNGMVTAGKGHKVLRACPTCQTRRSEYYDRDGFFGLYCEKCDYFSRLEEFVGQRAALLQARYGK